MTDDDLKLVAKATADYAFGAAVECRAEDPHIGARLVLTDAIEIAIRTTPGISPWLIEDTMIEVSQEFYNRAVGRPLGKSDDRRLREIARCPAASPDRVAELIADALIGTLDGVAQDPPRPADEVVLDPIDSDAPTGVHAILPDSEAR